MLQQIKKHLAKHANKRQAKILQGFFKTGRGEYGEGDIFLGIMVPEQRRVAKAYSDASLQDIKKLITSKIHEHRLTGLLILVDKYQNASIPGKRTIYNFYIKNAKGVNNWDLVDLTAPKVVGDYLFDKPKSILYKLAKSKNLWERRIAIIATLYFIQKNKFNETLKISEILLNDSHDLIHKAVGWMLREVGKKNQAVEEKFLKKHYKKMPRTMLRYAIERFDEKKRQFYLKN